MADPPDSQRMFADALGLSLAGPEGDDYVFTDSLEGTKHFGVWPLSQAAHAVEIGPMVFFNRFLFAELLRSSFPLAELYDRRNGGP